jgi:hypothetical protein
MLDRVKGGGRAHPTLHHGWNTRQKVAIATLCVLCGGHHQKRGVERGNMGEYRASTFKCLWGPGIDAKECIPPAYVVWRAGTKTLFLLGA